MTSVQGAPSINVSPTLRESYVTFGMSSGGLQRRYHAAASVGQKLYVWGGTDYSGSERVQTTTVESFDVSSESWLQSRQLHGTELPNGLQGVAITLVDESAYTFGGEAFVDSLGKFIYFNKLFEINLFTLQCREIVPEPHSPVPKQLSFSGMVHFNHMLVVHGGCCRYGQERTDDVHVFDLRTSECSTTHHIIPV